MTITRDALPLPDHIFPDRESQSAYQRCRALEASAHTIKIHYHLPPPIVCARLLGHLLRLAPDSIGRTQLQRRINIAKDNIRLMEIAAFYVHRFILTFEHSNFQGSVIPPPCWDLDDDDMEEEDGMHADDDEEYWRYLKEERRYREAWEEVEERDDYRCIVTGKPGWSPYRDSTFTILDLNRGVDPAHIITPRLVPHINRLELSDQDVRWELLSSFAGRDMAVELAHDIHSPRNLAVMSAEVSYFFKNLFLWLKPEGPKDEYHVYCLLPARKEELGIPDSITVSTSTGTPLPDRDYFSLHALCCEVAWLSGTIQFVRWLRFNFEIPMHEWGLKEEDAMDDRWWESFGSVLRPEDMDEATTEVPGRTEDNSADVLLPRLLGRASLSEKGKREVTSENLPEIKLPPVHRM